MSLYAYQLKRKKAADYVQIARRLQIRGQYNESIKWAQDSLSYLEFGQTYLIIGRSAYRLDKLNTAIEYLKKGVTIYERDFSKGIGEIKWIQDYCQACLIISGILYDKEHFQKSFQYTEKASILLMSQEETISQRVQLQLQQAQKRKQVYMQQKQKQKNERLVQAAPKVEVNRLVDQLLQEQEDIQKALRASMREVEKEQLTHQNKVEENG